MSPSFCHLLVERPLPGGGGARNDLPRARTHSSLELSEKNFWTFKIKECLNKRMRIVLQRHGSIKVLPSLNFFPLTSSSCSFSLLESSFKMLLSTSKLVFALGLPSLVFSQAARPRSTPLPSTTICERSPVDTLCSPSKSKDFVQYFDLTFRGRNPEVDGSVTEYVQVDLLSQDYKHKYEFGKFATKDELLPEVIRGWNIGTPCALNGTYVIQVSRTFSVQ